MTVNGPVLPDTRLGVHTAPVGADGIPLTDAGDVYVPEHKPPV